MISSERRLPGQPSIVIATGITAAAGLAATWTITISRGTRVLSPHDAALLLLLLGALIATYHFPIHVAASSKLYISGIALYLLAVLLIPAVAALAIGGGILLGELSVCRRTGNHRILSLIPTQVERWIIVGLAGSLAAHVASQSETLPLIAAGFVLWSGDILTGPLLLSPLLMQNPARIVIMMVREGGVFEGVQYIVGFLGAIEAFDQAWTLVLLVPPAVAIYFAFLRAKSTRAETRQVLEDMADVADQRDNYSDGHSRRVAELTADILRLLDRSVSEVDAIVFAARVHDIGKIGIPDDILCKPEKLSAAEMAIVRGHAERGADLLTRYPNFARSAHIVRHHHEAWDGTGYPDHLSGRDIPLGSRIIAVAESFDSMTNDLPYRLRMLPVEAAAILRGGSGTQWDPKMVNALLRVVREQIDTVPGVGLRLLSISESDAKGT